MKDRIENRPDFDCCMLIILSWILIIIGIVAVIALIMGLISFFG